VSAPFEPLRGDLPRVSTSLALAARDPGQAMPRVEQWALRMRTAFADLVIDGDRLLGRPRSAVGYISEVTAGSLATWAAAEVPQWQHRDMTSDDWAATVRILAGWVRARDAATAAATPADARRAAELAARRVHAARRAELADRPTRLRPLWPRWPRWPRWPPSPPNRRRSRSSRVAAAGGCAARHPPDMRKGPSGVSRGPLRCCP